MDSNVLPESNNLNVSTPNVLATEAVAVPNPNPNPSSLGGQTVDNTIVSSALNDVTTENIINPVVLDNNVKTVDNHIVETTGILGFMFDRNALGVSNLDRRVTTSYNPKGEYYNNFYKMDAGYFNDSNENAVVFFVA